MKKAGGARAGRGRGKGRNKHDEREMEREQDGEVSATTEEEHATKHNAHMEVAKGNDVEEARAKRRRKAK